MIADDVLNRAVEAGEEAIYQQTKGRGEQPVIGPFMRNLCARWAVEAAFPIIAEAAVKEEQARIKARIEALRQGESPYSVPTWRTVWRDGVKDALAVVTGKGGASDER